MNNSIVLNKISLKRQTLTYHFSVPESVKKYINPEYIDEQGNPFLFVEVPEKVRVDSIPEEILTIPFVGTMIGVATVCHMPIEVETIDSIYYRSLKEINSVFNEMYPEGNLKLTVQARTIKETKKQSKDGRTSVFFTGGVDATSALVEVIDRMPLLVNIVGGDIAISDQVAHEKLEAYFEELRENVNGLDFCFVKSNCRMLFKEYDFDRVFKKFIKREQWWGYWASIAHIVVMTAVVAPVLYFENVTEHYIGSSHASQDDAFDGNNEKIVNAIRYGNCCFISADANLDRNDKVMKIVKYSKEAHKYFKLQVCWYKKAGENCCRCEKCYRTIMNILSAHGDPNKFGFKYDDQTKNTMKKYLETTPIKLSYWGTTQSVLKKEEEYWKNTDLAWFVDFKFNQPKTYFYKVMNMIKAKVRTK